MLLNNFTLKLHFIPLWLAVEVYRRQGCKSLFEVGGAILGEGGYFIISGGACAIFTLLTNSWKGYIARVAPGICAHEYRPIVSKIVSRSLEEWRE